MLNINTFFRMAFNMHKKDVLQIHKYGYGMAYGFHSAYCRKMTTEMHIKSSSIQSKDSSGSTIMYVHINSRAQAL